MITPVELWQEIIDWVLFDPMLFNLDPFYSGCNFHTALNEWFDTKRMRTHEIQRVTLQLVSRSWKALADNTHWQCFKIHNSLNAALHHPQCRTARRVQLWPQSSLPWSLLNPHDSVHRFYSQPCFAEEEERQLGDHSSLAEIVEIHPRSLPDNVDMDRLYESILFSFPNLRTLVMSMEVLPAPEFSSLMSNLTILNLRIEDQAAFWDPAVFLPLPFVTTLRITVLHGCDSEFLLNWRLPSLIYLDLTHYYVDQAGIFEFLQMVGHTLRSLRLLVRYDVIPLPDDIWQMLPILEYIGLSEFQRALGGPPIGHSLQTVSIWEVEDDISNTRNEIIKFIGTWQNISTVADLHRWADVPKAFLTLVEAAESVSDLSMSVWYGIPAVYSTCSRHGMRYEDRNGQTYAEFCASVDQPVGDSV